MKNMCLSLYFKVLCILFIFVAFDVVEVSFASECTNCVKVIDDQCCKTSSDKVCCNTKNKFKYEKPFLKDNLKCPSSPISNRKLDSKGELTYYSLIITKISI